MIIAGCDREMLNRVLSKELKGPVQVDLALEALASAVLSIADYLEEEEDYRREQQDNA